MAERLPLQSRTAWGRVSYSGSLDIIEKWRRQQDSKPQPLEALANMNKDFRAGSSGAIAPVSFRVSGPNRAMYFFATT